VLQMGSLCEALGVLMTLIEKPSSDDLGFMTTTERRVLGAFADGKTRSEIASCLRLSVRTVGHALTSAKEQLGARSLAEAALRFRLALRD